VLDIQRLAPTSNGRYLIVSDTQIPYHHPKALEFVTYLKKHFKIEEAGCLHVGDEADNLAGSMHPGKGADQPHTPKQELQLTRQILHDWYKVFPQMKVATSNHMLRWLKKAQHIEMPSELLRSWSDVIEAPIGWKWADRWVIDDKFPFQIIHGMELSGQNATNQALQLYNISTAFGHLHSVAGVKYLKAGGQDPRWAMATGSLIDDEAYAFKYGKWFRYHSMSGAGIVMDHGKTALWIPL
jgi:hypothetical protein